MTRHNRAIEKSLKALRSQVKVAMEELNQRAAKLVARGAYDASQGVIESARDLAAFSGQLEALWQAWRGQLERGTRQDEKPKRTPIWEYYPLIARSLIELGGEAQVADVIATVGTLGAEQF